MLKSVADLRLEGISPSDYYRDRVDKAVAHYIRELITEAEFREDMAELTEAVIEYRNAINRAWGND